MKLCGFEAGLEQPFFLIAGPCVIESEASTLEAAGRLKQITEELGIPFIFKSSYDKANRSSHASYRGPGMEEGLRILDEVRRQVEVHLLALGCLDGDHGARIVCKHGPGGFQDLALGGALLGGHNPAGESEHGQQTNQNEQSFFHDFPIPPSIVFQEKPMPEPAWPRGGVLPSDFY